MDRNKLFSHSLLLSTWPCESRLGSALLKGAGRHLLQKEWRHGRSLGSLLWKLNLQIGQVSISPNDPCCFSLSSSAGKLSASFSTMITMSSLSTFSAFSSIFGMPNPDQRINKALQLGTKANVSQQFSWLNRGTEILLFWLTPLKT